VKTAKPKRPRLNFLKKKLMCVRHQVYFRSKWTDYDRYFLWNKSKFSDWVMNQCFPEKKIRSVRKVIFRCYSGRPIFSIEIWCRNNYYNIIAIYIYSNSSYRPQENGHFPWISLCNEKKPPNIFFLPVL
jgi:hypothetical protein